jgi:hypothetical protein
MASTGSIRNIHGGGKRKCRCICLLASSLEKTEKSQRRCSDMLRMMFDSVACCSRLGARFIPLLLVYTSFVPPPQSLSMNKNECHFRSYYLLLLALTECINQLIGTLLPQPCLMLSLSSTNNNICNSADGAAGLPVGRFDSQTKRLLGRLLLLSLALKNKPQRECLI